MGIKAVELRGALVANLPKGRLETRDQHRLVAVPGDWWQSVLSSVSGDVLRNLAESLVRDLVREARDVLDASADHDPESITHAVSVAFAIRGLGRVAFESWGDALVFAWSDAPATGAAFDGLAAEIASRIVSELSGAKVSGAAIGTVNGELKVLLSNATSCDHVRQAVARGGTFPQVLTSLESSEAAR